jgi:hypothetical protein
VTPIRILPEVAGDVAEAANYYDIHGYLGLGERFESVFYSSLSTLQLTVDAHRVVYDEFRRVLLKPFPCLRYYRVHNSVCVVALVIHAARDPERIRRFLQKRNSV